MNELSNNLVNTGKVLTKAKRKLIMFSIIVVVLLAIILAIFIKGYTSAKADYEQKIRDLTDQVAQLSDPAYVAELASTKIVINTINAEIQDIGELATQEYIYTNADTYTDKAKWLGVEVGFTEKSFLVRYNGTIKAGIDITKVTAQKSEDTKEIIVYMPKAKILSHEIDHDTMEIVEKKDNLLNSIELEDMVKFEAECKEKMQEKAVENGILTKASENAQNVLYKIVYNDVVAAAGYKVTFVELDEE